MLKAHAHPDIIQVSLATAPSTWTGKFRTTSLLYQNQGCQCDEKHGTVKLRQIWWALSIAIDTTENDKRIEIYTN
jgi:hypothetical protein